MSAQAFRSSSALQRMNSTTSGWSAFSTTILAARRVFPPDLMTPADELADAPLARGAAERAAEVLRHDDVGRELRPATRHLNVALLEDRLAALALDDGGAHLPLDLVERVRAGGRESPCDPDAVPGRTRLRPRPLHHVACRLLRHHAPPRNGMASRIHHHILCCQGIFCNGGST